MYAARTSLRTPSGVSSRKGRTGISRTPVKMPCPASFSTAASRAEDEGARGSSFAASASSQVVTVILHSTGEWDVISRRISASRVMSVPFVATAAPKP